MGQAIRMIFSTSGGDITLVSRQRVAMTLPRSVGIAGEDAPSEFFAELRGADARPLYRAALQNPLQAQREVYSEAADRSVYRIAVDEPEEVFSVLVPDDPEGDHVALMLASPSAPGGAEIAPSMRRFMDVVAGVAVRELARVPLHGPETGGEGS